MKSSSFSFEIEPKTAALALTGFNLIVDCEVRQTSREEYDVEWRAFDVNDKDVSSELCSDDVTAIERKAWSPPKYATDAAYWDFMDSKAGFFDKYKEGV